MIQWLITDAKDTLGKLSNDPTILRNFVSEAEATLNANPDVFIPVI